jgi:precorrin-8X/cobalt-precorrin-8 methylmutase
MSFERYIGIDWSGAAQVRDGIAVAQMCRADEQPQNVFRDFRWSRESVMDWLVAELLPGKKRTFVGLDFCFGYPAGAAKKVFDADRWSELPFKMRRLIDKRTARETAEHINAEKFVGLGPFRIGHAARNYDFYLRHGIGRYRHTELFAPGALSAWDVLQGAQVALSTITGIAALATLIEARNERRAAFSIYPFEDIGERDHVIAEVYPGLATSNDYHYPRGHAGDALRVAEWVRRADLEGRLLNIPSWPDAPANIKALIKEEGWIAGLALTPTSRIDQG